MDPLSIAIISGTVGGVAGVFSKEVWDLGRNWIHSFYKDHKPKAIAKAEQNSLDFLVQLAQRVKTLEEQGEQQEKVIEDSLNHPEFSALIQKAIIASAQTEDNQKHQILANLVADRLTKESESLFALSSQLACDAIAKLNLRQLKILGLLSTLWFIRPTGYPLPTLEKEQFTKFYMDFLTPILNKYKGLTFHKWDLLHLESLSCAKWDPLVSRDLKKVLTPSERSEDLDFTIFAETEVGKEIKRMWESDLQQCTPTTLGHLIGTYVTSNLVNVDISLEGWGEL